ncbi:aminodeoxychorismate lyase [Lacticaseibacillus chiayiensis]|uniref:Endolytic murein transglycosylase n=1 Tax=Lacticaseibacillus chiayiensis TaxID=2100821 RepID=A0A4Q1UFC4_9LACO|nr:endolytic transglycosylase MltG [Lacticaseibacillus chiayiensis]QVI33647.1 endolytic transglycosylase MltG [Lacticaseibacillus chiayiensis]RXT29578.1 aminodeoxychorismate lyase [Lacticaseibacillus chiayiensis]UYN55390.1 endolytic transglycosylase MltG [Lacticaseibacillus chiayiensis]
MDRRSRHVEDKRRLRADEKKASQKIVAWVLGILFAVLVIVGLMGYRYVHSALQPVNPSGQTSVNVTVPVGSSTKQIAAKLEAKHVIKSAMVFNYYVKFHNIADFQAGSYQLTQRDSMNQVIQKLRAGGTEATAAGQLLVKEGATIEQIATSVNKLGKLNQNLTSKKFMALMKNQTFFAKMAKKYPQLLSSAASAKGVRYRLEGYLFPATYSVSAGETVEDLVEAMLAKTNSVMQSYYKSIKKQGYTVQEVMTLASLVEREGVTQEDRRTIAGVFLNRIDAGMPLQSDISVMYALNTHKTHLTNKDTSVDSPYNLYVHTGYGPGPFDSPSEQSVRAVLSPNDRSKHYLYFVANLKTGEVLYATTREQHDANTAKFASDNAAANK